MGLLPLRHVVKFCRSLPTKILNTTKYAAHWGWDQHRKNCVSLLVSRWTEVKKLINCSYLKRQSACFRLCICICTVVMEIITVNNTSIFLPFFNCWGSLYIYCFFCHFSIDGWFVWFYGISTLAGYSTLNPFLCK